jgi:hypothetical protein
VGFSFTFALKVVAFDFTSSGIVAAALLIGFPNDVLFCSL